MNELKDIYRGSFAVVERGKKYGIEYVVVRVAGRYSIAIKCPRCGEWGRVVKSDKRYVGQAIKVIHVKTGSSVGCTFSYSTKAKIYDKIIKLLSELRTSFP